MRTLKNADFADKKEKKSAFSAFISVLILKMYGRELLPKKPLKSKINLAIRVSLRKVS